MFIVIEYFKITVNDSGAEKSARGNRVVLLTELDMNRTQCTETYKNGKSQQKTDKKNVPQIVPLYLLEVLYKSQGV